MANSLILSVPVYFPPKLFELEYLLFLRSNLVWIIPEHAADKNWLTSTSSFRDSFRGAFLIGSPKLSGTDHQIKIVENSLEI